MLERLRPSDLSVRAGRRVVDDALFLEIGGGAKEDISKEGKKYMQVGIFDHPDDANSRRTKRDYSSSFPGG